MGIIDLPGARLRFRRKTDDLTRERVLGTHRSLSQISRGAVWRLGQACRGLKCAKFELGAWFQVLSDGPSPVSVYLNDQAQIKAEDNNNISDLHFVEELLK